MGIWTFHLHNGEGKKVTILLGVAYLIHSAYFVMIDNKNIAPFLKYLIAAYLAYYSFVLIRVYCIGRTVISNNIRFIKMDEEQESELSESVSEFSIYDTNSQISLN